MASSGSLKRRWRREVEAFADAMEAKLRENDHKGGWKWDTASQLMKRLREETEELATVLTFHDERPVLREAADVANFAMMIADIRGGLLASQSPRSRKRAAHDVHEA